MITMKRMLACSVLIIFALVIVIPELGTGAVKASTAIKPEDNQEYHEESYSTYLSSQGYNGKMALSEIKVDLMSYKTSDDMQARLDNGAVVTGESGTITWHVSVQEAGFYNIAVTYLPIKGTNSKIERKLWIDDKSYFTGMNQLILGKVWENSEDKQIAQKNGNENTSCSCRKTSIDDCIH